MTQQRDKFFDMAGAGLDLITPAIKRHPASAIGGNNYEPRPEGYKRFAGFERIDGKGLPSDSLYSTLEFDTGTIAIAAGDIVTGLSSGAAGTLLVDAVVKTGSFGGGDAAGTIPLWGVSGTFIDNEALQVSAVTRALADGTNALEDADNDTDDFTWRSLAIEAKRDTIGTVTGSGKMLGIWNYKGDVYAFRNNVGDTACDMWKGVDTPAGWEAVDLDTVLHFTGGTTEIFDLDAINGQTSGATADVDRVVLLSGNWSTNDAAGFLILTNIVGTWLDAENIRVSTNFRAIASGVPVAGALGAGGIFEFITHNFFGAADTSRIYGCNGAGKGFVFDGDFANIETGMVPDEPQHIGVKLDTLFFSFAGGSLQFSGGGAPLVWSAVLGAGEIGMGDQITGIAKEYSNGMAILSRNKTAILYGTDFSSGGDASLETISDQAGAIERTVQMLVKPTFFDNTGIRDLTAVQNFGNFKFGDGDGLSGMIKPLLNSKAKAGIQVTASVVIKDQVQYWLFFDDMTALVMSMATGKPKIMPILLPIVVECAFSTEDGNGDEVIYVGSNDGFVYSFGTGNNFDGAPLDYLLRLSFWHLGSQRLEKRFHKTILELDPSKTGPTTLKINADFSYGDPNLPAIVEQSLSTTGGGGFWDISNWDEFFWDAEAEGQASAFIDGLGKNISMGLGGSTQSEDPHTITGNTYLYSPRRMKR